MRTHVLPVFLAVLICAFWANAATRRALPSLEGGLSVSVAALYNDNFLKLSERDEDRYLSYPESFHDPVKSVDDLENEISLRPTLRWRAPFTLMAFAQYTFKNVSRSRNSFTDYQTHSLSISLRQRVNNYKWLARFRAFTLPSFYLRDYRDRDYNQYHAARFRNSDFSGTFRYRLIKPLWLEVGGGFSAYDYNAKFTEFDSEVTDFSASAIWSLPSHVTLNCGYDRSLSDNVGKSQIGVNGDVLPSQGEEDTEYGDADYHEDEFNAKVSTWLPWIRFTKADASLDYKFRRRVYTTTRNIIADPFHSGRVDHRTEITPSVTVGLAPQLELEAYFTYESRRTDSKHATVSLVKNFDRREYGLVLNYLIY